MRTLFSSAVFRLLLGAALISLSPFFVEISQLDAFANSFYRSLIGGVVFLGISLFRKHTLPSLKTFKLCLLAALAISTDLVLWNQSVLYIGAGLGTILANLEIIFMILLGVLFFREKISPMFGILCLFIALGVFLLIQPHFSDHHPHIGLGVSFALTASLVFSVYLFFLKIITSNHSSSMLPLLAVICLAAAFFTAIFMLFTPTASFSIDSLRGLTCITLNGLLSQVFGWILLTHGIRKLHFSVSGLLLLMQPALTFCLDCFLFHRNTQALQILGCLLILSGVFTATFMDNKKKQPAKA